MTNLPTLFLRHLNNSNAVLFGFILLSPSHCDFLVVVFCILLFVRCDNIFNIFSLCVIVGNIVLLLLSLFEK